jgi:hypothetical protein
MMDGVSHAKAFRSAGFYGQKAPAVLIYRY